LYEYKCNNCGHTFEKIVKFSDEPLRVCPQCGKEAIEQLLSAPAVQFKGAGWYVNDYARKGSAPSGGSSDKKGDVNASTDSKSETKSETKSESKSESKSDSTSSTPKSDSGPSTSSDSKK
jgi:putative FmdB family regulatory protein